MEPVIHFKKKLNSFLTLEEITPHEFTELITEALYLKKNPSLKKRHPLEGKVLGCIFEKNSTRTRVSFETGMIQLGGSSIYLSSKDLQLGRGETIEDTAKTLSQYLDGIMIRAYSHSTVTKLSEAASIPVINGLTDLHHPCQAVADYLTIKEVKGSFKNVKMTYLGDGNNVLHSLLIGAALSGLHLVYSCPPAFLPDPTILTNALKIAQHTGAKLEYQIDPEMACENTDFIYTDVWVSMGQENENETRVQAFKPYQVNSDLTKWAAKDFHFLHCLPAIREQEVTAEIIDGKHSLVFQQAGNRLHGQNAVLLKMLGE